MGAVAAAVVAHGIPVVLVDDGSSRECRLALEELAMRLAPAATLVRLPENQGKGAAVTAGLREGGRLGYSHALQIDADGQHDVLDIPRFLALSRDHPEDLICGRPIFDASVPMGRLWGRYVTHVWVWINTLSFEIADSLCGFRVYPLAPVLTLLREVRLGRRMDFDCEVLVRLHWRGMVIRNLGTRVHYPEGGRSHFRLFEDNVRISWMHARLFLGMVLRSPALLWRRVARRFPRAEPPR